MGKDKSQSKGIELLMEIPYYNQVAAAFQKEKSRDLEWAFEMPYRWGPGPFRLAIDRSTIIVYLQLERMRMVAEIVTSTSCA